MLEIWAELETDSLTKVFHTKGKEPKNGSLNIVHEFPKGKLNGAIAVLDISASENKSTFKNGVAHELPWCYFRKDDRFRLIASLNENPGHTTFRYDSEQNVLTIERDCESVDFEGGEFHVFDLYFAEGSEKEVFDGWLAAIGDPH